MNNRDIVKQQSDFILYTGNDGKVNIDVFVQDETIWLTQNAIGKLFGNSEQFKRKDRGKLKEI